MRCGLRGGRRAGGLFAGFLFLFLYFVVYDGSVHLWRVGVNMAATETRVLVSDKDILRTLVEKSPSWSSELFPVYIRALTTHCRGWATRDAEGRQELLRSIAWRWLPRLWCNQILTGVFSSSRITSSSVSPPLPSSFGLTADLAVKMQHRLPLFCDFAILFGQFSPSRCTAEDAPR